MKILISILFNGLILFAISYFLPYNATTQTGVIATGSWQLYITGGLVLGVLNFAIKPILKLLGLPFIIISLGLFMFVINGIILYLLEMIIKGLSIEGVGFTIKGIIEFIIAVAIFTIFNTIYNTLIKK
ncbi:phage holin family protein [Candidatus Gracilibacteria bacterium]|nr:phage holin family protein [Candidatus Gracilibacteria bacterium]